MTVSWIDHATLGHIAEGYEIRSKEGHRIGAGGPNAARHGMILARMGPSITPHQTAYDVNVGDCKCSML